MSLDVPISELQQAAKEEVYDARRNGSIKDLTPRMIRRSIEKKFSLKDSILDTKDEEFTDLRAQLKSAIAEAIEEDLPPAKVESSKAKTVTTTKKRKSEEVLEPKSSKKQNTKSEKPKNTSKKFKSLETVPTSDIEPEDPEVNDTADTSTELEKPPADPSGEAAKTRVPPAKLKENRALSPKRPTSKPNSSVAKSKAGPSTASPEAPDSESELSVLDDEPPKKKSKTTKSKNKNDDKSKSSKGKKATGSLSKDEETIKRLKSLVLACGVRRQWAKVFKDVDSPSQQIRMLKEILADLGMSGRMSLEQAKAIKEKRELAQELEDVQSFAAAATRSKASKASQEKDEEESEEEELPEKRKTNARKSIMDFLGDQSSDDD
ncbi:hypothetical protein C8R45DRAFT_969504 [Mycena sanguinolenta]|nr:hypothetical protein C8R45DRAFT_969504 [Mycena sanguinolenta]